MSDPTTVAEAQQRAAKAADDLDQIASDGQAATAELRLYLAVENLDSGLASQILAGIADSNTFIKDRQQAAGKAANDCKTAPDLAAAVDCMRIAENALVQAKTRQTALNRLIENAK